MLMLHFLAMYETHSSSTISLFGDKQNLANELKNTHSECATQILCKVYGVHVSATKFRNLFNTFMVIYCHTARTAHNQSL